MGQKIDLTQQVQGILPEANGGAGPNIGQRFSDAETPVGTINGVNTSFTLSNAPNPALSLLLFVNKTLQIQGTDYTLSGSALTMIVAPPGGVTFLGWYRYLGFGFSLSFSDGLILLDSLSVDAPVAKIPLSAQDQLTLSDRIAFVRSPDYYSEFFILNDAVVVVAPIIKSLSDSSTMTDAFAKTLT